MFNSPIQAYDIAMLAVLVLATLYGLWKGAAWQVASVASLVISFLVSMEFGGALAPYLSNDPRWGPIIAMLVLYLSTSLVIWLLFRMVAGFIDRLRLREFDHQIGGLLGLIKGVLFCLVITFFAVTLSEQARQSVLRSNSGQLIALLIRQGAPAMPEDVWKVVGPYVQKLEEELDPNRPAEPEQSEPAPDAQGPAAQPAKRPPQPGSADRGRGENRVIPGENAKSDRT